MGTICALYKKSKKKKEKKKKKKKEHLSNYAKQHIKYILFVCVWN